MLKHTSLVNKSKTKKVKLLFYITLETMTHRGSNAKEKGGLIQYRLIRLTCRNAWLIMHLNGKEKNFYKKG